MLTIKTYYIDNCSEFTECMKSIVIRTKDIKQVIQSNGLLTVYYDKVNTSPHRQQSEQGIITLKGDSASELFGTEFIKFVLNKSVMKQYQTQLDETTLYGINILLRERTGEDATLEMVEHAIKKCGIETSISLEEHVEAIITTYKLRELTK